MFAVTLKQLRDAKACVEGYNKVVCMLSGKEFDPDRETYMRFKHEGEISLIDIANNNGIDDALWATRCLIGKDRDLRLYAVWRARQVQHLMKDERSIEAINVAERFANGEATSEELAAAQAAARDAARADARADACAAACAAAWDDAWYSARAAAWYSARAAAWYSAQADAWYSARAAAWYSALADAWYSARADAPADQKQMFINMCNGTAPWQMEE